MRTAAADAERQKLAAVVELFRKYGTQYKVACLLMAAQSIGEAEVSLPKQFGLPLV